MDSMDYEMNFFTDYTSPGGSAPPPIDPPTSAVWQDYLEHFALCPRTPRGSLRLLPDEICLNHLFTYLAIEDIICMRRVNKRFYFLTHEPVIWMRFLSRMELPLPPVSDLNPLSTRWPAHFEAEQLVTRAITMDDNWKKDCPSVYNIRSIPEFHKILEMKILHGAKYLVASLQDAASDRFYIIIFSLEGPMANGKHAIVRAPVSSRAYHVQTKYMQYKGRQGIMTLFLQRRFKNGRVDSDDTQNPLSDSFKDEEEAGDPYLYECTCLFTPLNTLDLLVQYEMASTPEEFAKVAAYLAANKPPPFERVFHYEGFTQLDDPSLFEINGAPHIAFILKPDIVVICNATTGERSFMKCNIKGDIDDHYLNAIRILPGQNQLLAISTIEREESLYRLIELFDLPVETGPSVSYAETYTKLAVHAADTFHISESCIPSQTSEYLTFKPASHPPPPISIWAQFSPLDGTASSVMHYALWPSHFETCERTGRVTSYSYSLKFLEVQDIFVDASKILIIPGVHRALACSFSDSSSDSTQVMIGRYVHPEIAPAKFPFFLRRQVNKTALRRENAKHSVPRGPTPTHLYQQASGPRWEVYPQLMQSGVSAIAWDESFGRVCIAGEDEAIKVVDFGQVVQTDVHYERWRLKQLLSTRTNIGEYIWKQEALGERHDECPEMNMFGCSPEFDSEQQNELERIWAASWITAKTDGPNYDTIAV